MNLIFMMCYILFLSNIFLYNCLIKGMDDTHRLKNNNV